LISGVVFDSFALFSFFEAEKGADQVNHYLKQARREKAKCLMSIINWGEVYYISLREGGEQLAQDNLKKIERLPIEIILADQQITLAAADFKGRHKMAYADCFAAGLSKVTGLPLLTGGKEFKSVEESIQIIWI